MHLGCGISLLPNAQYVILSMILSVSKLIGYFPVDSTVWSLQQNQKIVCNDFSRPIAQQAFAGFLVGQVTSCDSQVVSFTFVQRFF